MVSFAKIYEKWFDIDKNRAGSILSTMRKD
jgi:hypothetical protein